MGFSFDGFHYRQIRIGGQDMQGKRWRQGIAEIGKDVQ